MDDDAQVRHVLSRVVSTHGLSTLEAGSGADALAVLAREGEVPVCISDIYMPEMDGVTFLREAGKRYPDMAMIMLTGVAEVNTAVECLKLGALDYISKPVMVEEVLNLLGSAKEVRDGVEAWYDAGVTTPILVPSSTHGGQFDAVAELFEAFE